jgi:hypothetical protein
MVQTVWSLNNFVRELLHWGLFKLLLDSDIPWEWTFWLFTFLVILFTLSFFDICLNLRLFLRDRLLTFFLRRFLLRFFGRFVFCFLFFWLFIGFFDLNSGLFILFIFCFVFLILYFIFFLIHFTYKI